MEFGGLPPIRQRTSNGWGTEFRWPVRSLPRSSGAWTDRPGKRGRWSAAVSHPFGKERRMDGARGFMGDQKSTPLKRSLDGSPRKTWQMECGGLPPIRQGTPNGWGTEFRWPVRSLPRPSGAWTGNPGMRGRWSAAVSHPFGKERRMDGARSSVGRFGPSPAQAKLGRGILEGEIFLVAQGRTG
jgi:hypothetical protein